MKSEMEMDHLVWTVLVCVLLTLHLPPGDSQVIGSPHPITVIAGDDVILPCSLNHPISPEDLGLEWSRPDQRPQYVHMYQDGRDFYYDQNLSFKNRTTLFKGELKNGNFSLKLSSVRPEDEGEYRCLILSLASQDKDTVIQLKVAACPSCQPVVSILGLRDGEVVLQCESNSWYPDPQLEWLDSGGAILSAEVPVPVRDPDGHYSVRSNVTVKETNTNRFICKVQLLRLNHSREAEILVPADIFKTVAAGVIIGLGVFSAAMMVVVIAVLTYCIMQYKHGLNKKTAKNHHILTSESEKEKQNHLLQPELQQKDKTIQSLEEHLASQLRELEQHKDELEGKLAELQRDQTIQNVEKQMSDLKDTVNTIHSLWKELTLLSLDLTRDLVESTIRLTDLKQRLPNHLSCLQQKDMVIQTLWEQLISKFYESCDKQIGLKTQTDELEGQMFLKLEDVLRERNYAIHSLTTLMFEIDNTVQKMKEQNFKLLEVEIKHEAEQLIQTILADVNQRDDTIKCLKKLMDALQKKGIQSLWVELSDQVNSEALNTLQKTWKTQKDELENRVSTLRSELQQTITTIQSLEKIQAHLKQMQEHPEWTIQDA